MSHAKALVSTLRDAAINDDFDGVVDDDLRDRCDQRAREIADQEDIDIEQIDREIEQEGG